MTTSQQIARIIRNRSQQGFSPRAIAYQVEKELNKENKMNTIEITATQTVSKPSWWIRHFAYRTNRDFDVSVIDDKGGYEIIVFDDWNDAVKQVWVSTVDEMIKRFSELVAEYTVEGVLA